MLRLLVVLLLLANAGFFAWTQGWLAPVLSQAPASGRDPQRLAQQVHPERLILNAPAAADMASQGTPGGVTDTAQNPAQATNGAASGAPSGAESGAAASAPQPSTSQAAANLAASTVLAGACLEAGPFTTEEQQQWQPVLARALPAGSLSTQTVAVPGLWLVYMGPYPDADTLARKQAELRRIRSLSFEEVRSPANLSMGLSLGRFNVEAQAQASLESLKLRGVRTARVVTLRPPMDLTVLRIPVASALPAATRQRLAGIALPPGKGLVACESR
jgi:hypothetical protein